MFGRYAHGQIEHEVWRLEEVGISGVEGGGEHPSGRRRLHNDTIASRDDAILRGRLILDERGNGIERDSPSLQSPSSTNVFFL
jgi:hypothetical protein